MATGRATEHMDVAAPRPLEETRHQPPIGWQLAETDGTYTRQGGRGTLRRRQAVRAAEDSHDAVSLARVDVGFDALPGAEDGGTERAGARPDAPRRRGLVPKPRFAPVLNLLSRRDRSPAQGACGAEPPEEGEGQDQECRSDEGGDRNSHRRSIYTLFRPCLHIYILRPWEPSVSSRRRSET